MKRAYQRRKNPDSATDCVMTPPDLAKKIVRYFKPKGKCLEPCHGKGSFYNAMGRRKIEWDEINLGRDFYDRSGDFDWIITNPPWSQLSGISRA